MANGEIRRLSELEDAAVALVGSADESETPRRAAETPRTGSLPVPSNEFFRRHGLPSVLAAMVKGLDAARPEDPYLWMIQHLTECRRRRSAQNVEVSGRGGGSAPPADKPAARKGKGKTWRVNTSDCLKRTCKALLDKVFEGSDEYVQEQSPTGKGCDIYFVWSGSALLARLRHPSSKDVLPRLPDGAWISRMPGIACLCDKVNMALALRLLQKLWPEKFRFWPRSWLLPAESDKLKSWLSSHKGETVIVKPEGGSMGEGIFLVQSSSDLDIKVSAKSNWGAGFGALAQRYLPKPFLLDGLKFDLRLYVVVTSIDPLEAYMCKDGLARFCTAKYETPTQGNANEVYMHLTNYSVNKRSTKFVKDDDAFDVSTGASKRPLSTLLGQIAAAEAAAGRVFDEDAFFRACEEVAVVFLQAIAPVMNVTYGRVVREAKPKPKPRAKPKPRPKSRLKRNAADTDDEDMDDDSDGSEDGSGGSEDDYSPNCFQILGIDVLLDEKLQPWLLEVNARPSMDISNPVRIAEAPAGMRRCACRDMDGEEHVHLPSEVDIFVKRLVVGGAFQLVTTGGLPPGFLQVNFEQHSPSEAQETLQAIARIYERAGGMKKAFTTLGLRKALAGAIGTGLTAHDLDTVVTKWKHQGYRQDGNAEEDEGDIGVLDFAALLQEVACMREKEEDPLDALTSLVDLCDPDDE